MEQTVVLPRRNPLRTIIKAVLHVIVKAIILLRRAILRHPIATLILLTMLLGSYLAISTGVVSIAWLGMPATVNDGRPTAIAQYLDGQQKGDVTLMWEGLSDDIKQDQDAFQSARQELEFAKLNGISFTDSTYIGGSTLNDGTSVHLFVVSMSNGNNIVQVPWTFRLNQAGKIIAID